MTLNDLSLNDLLAGKSFDPQAVLVMRHRPYEPRLKKVMPWLAAERPELFNAYQQTQGARVERAMQRAKYVASFIGKWPAKALFVGLYSIDGWKEMTYDACANLPSIRKLTELGHEGFNGENIRPKVLWFNTSSVDFYAHWRGKLVVAWPPPEISWWRWAAKNEMAVLSVLDESVLAGDMPPWEEISLTWQQLAVLPISWRVKLAEWTAIYLIRDTSDGKGYVGSAYGGEKLLQRWLGYAKTGHGGNRLLKKRDSRNFIFSILQLPSPNMDKAEVIRLEHSWKLRLCTRHPHGLNDN